MPTRAADSPRSCARSSATGHPRCRVSGRGHKYACASVGCKCFDAPSSSVAPIPAGIGVLRPRPARFAARDPRTNLWPRSLEARTGKDELQQTLPLGRRDREHRRDQHRLGFRATARARSTASPRSSAVSAPGRRSSRRGAAGPNTIVRRAFRAATAQAASSSSAPSGVACTGPSRAAGLPAGDEDDRVVTEELERRGRLRGRSRHRVVVDGDASDPGDLDEARAGHGRVGQGFSERRRRTPAASAATHAASTFPTQRPRSGSDDRSATSSSSPSQRTTSCKTAKESTLLDRAREPRSERHAPSTRRRSVHRSPSSGTTSQPSGACSPHDRLLGVGVRLQASREARDGRARTTSGQQRAGCRRRRRDGSSSARRRWASSRREPRAATRPARDSRRPRRRRGELDPGSGEEVGEEGHRRRLARGSGDVHAAGARASQQEVGETGNESTALTESGDARRDLRRPGVEERDVGVRIPVELRGGRQARSSALGGQELDKRRRLGRGALDDHVETGKSAWREARIAPHLAIVAAATAHCLRRIPVWRSARSRSSAIRALGVRAELMLSSSDCESRPSRSCSRSSRTPKSACDQLRLGYTEVPGSRELRDAIAGSYERVGAEDVLALAAAEEGIFVAYHALLRTGRPRRGRDAVLRVGARDRPQHRRRRDAVAKPLRGRLGARRRRARAAAATGDAPACTSTRRTTRRAARCRATCSSGSSARAQSTRSCCSATRCTAASSTTPPIASRRRATSTSRRYRSGAVSKAHGLPGLRIGWLGEPRPGAAGVASRR